MRVLLVRMYGEIREIDLSTTSIGELENLKRIAKDFEIIEYKGA